MNRRLGKALAIAALLAGSAGTLAAPASASTPSEGGATWTTMGCSAFKNGGMRHTSTRDASQVDYYDAIKVRTCLRRSGTTMYAMTQWYMPHGGYVVGVVYSAVQDCANLSPSASYGGRTDGYPDKYYAGRDTAHMTTTYSNNVYGTAGHRYRARGWNGGDAQMTTAPVFTWALHDSPTVNNVNSYSPCFTL